MWDIRFEWDKAKSRENERKHGVSFEEAQSVFFDENAIRYFDPDHSPDEDRFLMLGDQFQIANFSRVPLLSGGRPRNSDYLCPKSEPERKRKLLGTLEVTHERSLRFWQDEGGEETLPQADQTAHYDSPG
jgi:hypothetical protein